MALPKLLRLREAAELLGGGITERALRAEVRAGRLSVVRIAGKFFTTEDHLAAMVGAATTRLSCPADDSLPDSTSVQPEPAAEPSGSFSTDRKRLALVQARESVKRLKRPLNNTSPGGTDHRVVPIGRGNSSAPRS
jgi:hypothetical protein